MKNFLLTPLFFICITLEGVTQNLPTSYQIGYEYLRREQIKGNLSQDLSFNIRPLTPQKAITQFSDPYLRDSISDYKANISPVSNKKGNIRISPLPVSITTTYNSSMPGGWQNGALIPSVGLQTLITGGVHLKVGILSLQFNPQYHYAQNKQFEEYPEEAPDLYFRYLRRSVSGIDAPVRFGTGTISDVSLGNSHIGVNLGGLFIGLSSENLWTGPGQFTSLVVSDNAPGFNHIRIQSTKPLETFMGNFEGVYWAGQLKSSKLPHFSDGNYQNIFGEKDETSWRYFTGLSISYNPKWIPGFSLGLTRGFQVYREDMGDSFKSLFPLFAPFQKEVEGLIESRDLRQDQNVSVFSRYVIPKAKTEFYFEFSRNDHPLNWRDLVLSPEHSRAFQLGFSKYMNITEKYSLGIQSEITQTQFSINNVIRWANHIGSANSGLGSYDNFQVRHGWTNKGEVIGSNTGISGNSQILKLGMYSGFKEISIKMERLENQPNFYRLANTAGLDVKPWVNQTIYANYSNNFKNLLLKSSLGFTRTLNYNSWIPQENFYFPSKGTSFNLSMNLALIYLL